MSIRLRLIPTFTALLVTFGVAGSFAISKIDRSLRSVKRDTSAAEDAASFEMGAAKLRIGASLLARGNRPLGEQFIREGEHEMASRRVSLEKTLGSSFGEELAEISRIEGLAVAAAKKMTTSKAKVIEAKSELSQAQNFLEARAEALSLRLGAFSEMQRKSTAESIEESERGQKLVIAALGASFLIALVLGALLSRRLNSGISILSDGARRLEKGDLETTIEIQSKDELGQLAHTYNDMTRSLRGTMQRLELRNQDMSRVLTSVQQGLFMLDREGRVSEERSAAADRFFGPMKGQELFTDVLARNDSKAAAIFAMGWESVLEGFMPLEVTLDQLLKRIVLPERTCELSYVPTLNEQGELEQVLVVVSDISERLAAEKAEADQKAILGVLERVMRDKVGFLEFFDEARLLVHAVTEDDVETTLLKRQLHTLKGNCALFGVSGIAQFCNDLESKLEESGGHELAEGDRAVLLELWDGFAGRLERVLGTRQTRKIEVEDSEYEAVLLSVVRGSPRSEIATMIAQWKFEPARARLDRMAEQAEGLARRLGKDPIVVEIEVDPAGLRLPDERWASFWASLTHLLRNAIDHGLETKFERERAGKPLEGKLALRARTQEDEIVLELEDEGEGVDWERVRGRAIARGLPSATQADLEQALFTDGFSTRDQASETSGRGVGLSAVRAEVEKLGGAIRLLSVRGKGTLFRIALPMVQPDSHDGHRVRLSVIPESIAPKRLTMPPVKLWPAQQRDVESEPPR